jgi:hypothetical protein
MCISRKICIDTITVPHSRLGSCVRNTDGIPQNATWPGTVLLTASHLTLCEFGKLTAPDHANFVILPFVKTDGTKQTEQPATQRVGLHDLQQDTCTL